MHRYIKDDTDPSDVLAVIRRTETITIADCYTRLRMLGIDTFNVKQINPTVKQLSQILAQAQKEHEERYGRPPVYFSEDDQ